MKLEITDTLTFNEDGVTYEVTSSVGALRIASGASSGTLSLSAYGWRKEGDGARAAYSCYFAMYTRTGSTYSRIGYSSAQATSWASGSKTIASTVDEVILVISDSVLSSSTFASALPSSFLAKTSVQVSKDGTGISAVTEYYLASASSSGVTRNTSGWTTDPTASAATITAEKKYLWNYEAIAYSDGTTIYTDPVIIGRFGEKGSGISSVTEYYLASSSASGVTRSTSGWTNDPTASAAKLTATKKYLWNYEKVTYSDNSTAYTDPVIIGVYGDKGVGLTSVTEFYLASSSASGVTRSTSGWTNDPTASAAKLTASKKYLWNYEAVTYSDNSTAYTDPVIIGTYGENGTGISSVVEYYLASSSASGVTRSTSGWTTDPTANAAKLTATKKYLWNYEKVTYSDNSTEYTDPVIIGTYGDKGDGGDHAAIAMATPDKISIQFNSDGTIYSSISQLVTFSMKVGTGTATITGITTKSLPAASVSVSGSGTSSRTISVGSSARSSDLQDPVVFTITGTYDGKTYSADCSVLLAASVQGEEGPQGPQGPTGPTGPQGPAGQSIVGDPGKMCYIAGEYRDDIEYISDNRQTVAVEIPVSGNQTELWYLDAATNVVSGTHISPETPGQTLWKQGLNNYNLIRTKYLFADFALLASAVVSGDYLFSMNGRLDGVNYNSGATWKGAPAYMQFAGDPAAYTIPATQRTITLTTSYNAASDTFYLEAGKTVILKLVIKYHKRLTQVAMFSYYGSSAETIQHSSENSDSWGAMVSTMSIASSTPDGSIYYIRFTPSSSGYYLLKAKVSSTGTDNTFTMETSRVLFEPNWWVDLLTGKMSGARGNFIVKPDGGMSVAGDKMRVDANGDVVMNDIEVNNARITGSLMFHKVEISGPTTAEQGAQLFTMYDAYGNVVPISGAATVVRTVLKCDTFILTGAKRNYTVFLPPAVFFPGAKIKIINGTYTGSTGDLVKDLSTITLSVVHRSDTEGPHEDPSNEEMNSLSTAIPFDISNGGVIFGYRTEMEFNIYSSIELISMLNPESPNYTQTLKNYVWMIIDAK